jgi:hypothetical protein
LHGPSGQPSPACDIRVWISVGENAAPTYGLAAFAIVDSAGRAIVAVAAEALGLVNVGAAERTPEPAGVEGCADGDDVRAIEGGKVALADWDACDDGIGVDGIDDCGGDDFSAGCTFERSVPVAAGDSPLGIDTPAGRSS